MEEQTPLPHCQFFVKRKKRFCRMTLKKGNSFCGEHMVTADDGGTGRSARVPCPIDPTHTCYESRLTRHIKVCNTKRLADEQPPYIVRGINLGDVDKKTEKRVPLSELSQSVVDNIIEKVKTAHERLPPVPDEILRDEMMNAEIENPLYGRVLRKHLLQNASLLGHAKRTGFVRKNTCFVEFGAGKGKLTYWLAQAIRHEAGSSVVLIDRSSHRHKSDNKLKNEECPVDALRIRADIADLRLINVDEINKTEHVVGIAKHLCGVATDLTIRCLAAFMKDDPSNRLSGLILSFCCHHRCDYSSYVGKEYLKSCGFTEYDFPVLCSIASWATCGTGKNRDSLASGSHEKDGTIAKRETIGRKVKSLLNWGRIEYMKNIGFDCNLVYYTPRQVSLENMCMIAVRRK